MPDLATTTTDALLTRLAEIEPELETKPTAGEPIDAGMRRMFALLAEIGRIHIELARRTATGWRPL